MKCFLPLFFIFFILVGCKKDSNTERSTQRYCWNIIDETGNILMLICDKTEDELIHCTTCGTFNGTSNWNLDTCNYFRNDDPKFCWIINNTKHISNKTEKEINCIFRNSIKEKISCSYTCDEWYTRKKYTYKPTGVCYYSNVSGPIVYCNSDYYLFNSPDSIVIKNDVDSLILLQRSKDGRFFY